MIGGRHNLLPTPPTDRRIHRRKVRNSMILPPNRIQLGMPNLGMLTQNCGIIKRVILSYVHLFKTDMLAEEIECSGVYIIKTLFK